MRWEVFKQDAASRPHQAVGSVHGADPDHAMLNARHVFARRPAAVSLWIAPEDRVYSRTAEELAATDPQPRPRAGAVGDDVRERLFHVFVKPSYRRSMTFADHVGSVLSASHGQALTAALSELAGAAAGLAWLVVADEDVHRTAPDDAASWFEPAREKTYKQQSAYGTVRPRGGPAGDA